MIEPLREIALMIGLLGLLITTAGLLLGAIVDVIVDSFIDK